MIIFILYLAFVSLDINESDDSTNSIMISEAFSKSFEALKLQLTKMTGNLNSLNAETKKLGTSQDSHNLREEM